MHLVATTEVTNAGPRWASPVVVPPTARAIAVGLERTTVIVIESRDGVRTSPVPRARLGGPDHCTDLGEVLRTRHVGLVRLLAGDGKVLARRRLATASGAGDALLAHLLDEVRAAVASAPGLVVGLVQDAGDHTWHQLAAGLAELRAEGAIRGWTEAIDRGALRERLERTLCVIEPTALAREERLDHWDACLDAWDDAIDGVAMFLEQHRDNALHPATVDAQLHYLAEHRGRMRYARLRRAGLALAADPGSPWEARMKVRRPFVDQ